MKLYYPITVDLYNTYPLPKMTAQQHNVGRGALITLTANGQVITPSKESIRIFAKRPDGNVSYLDCGITDDGKIQADFTDQMLATKGSVEVELELTTTETNITTPIFVVEVNKSNVKEGVKSSNEYKALEELAKIYESEGENSFATNDSSVATGEYASASGMSNTASGTRSHAQGRETDAIGDNSHSEGYNTKANGDVSHAEGGDTESIGGRSHAEGTFTKAIAAVSHAEGELTQSEGYASHTEGHKTRTTETAINSHAEGNGSVSRGETSHSEGELTESNGYASHTEGYKTVTTEKAKYAHSEGYQNKSDGLYSHSEGYKTEANGDVSHSEGGSTKANSAYSHSEGHSTETNGLYSHSEGHSTKANGVVTHAEGYETEANGTYSHTEGLKTVTATNGEAAHAEGLGTRSYGLASHTEGIGTITRGTGAHAEGCETEAIGAYSHVEGYGCVVSEPYSHVQGKYNKLNNVTESGEIKVKSGDYAHIVGNGIDSKNRSNAYTLSWEGKGYFAQGTTMTGADYAEFFEWLDGNPNNEDRVGLLVTLEGEKIRLADACDEVLGIISGTAAVLGDNYECEWNGKYLTDDFGRVIYDMVEEFIEVPHVKVDDKGIITETVETVSLGFFKHPRINPDYDPEQAYVNRSNRPEWDAVGMIGKLYVRDDGTCQVNGYATVGANGITTASNETTNMRVLSRVNENVVKVLLK